MPSNLFRNRLISKIKAAIAEYREAASMSHKVLKGRVREIAIQNLFDPLLSPDFQVGTGTIVDKDGKQSPETDLIIYSKKLLPPILYSERFGTFLLDYCLAIVEIKSKLTSNELKRAIKNALIMQKLNYSSYKQDSKTKRISTAVVTRTLFAFESDLSQKDEFERYKESDSGWKQCPLLKSFCVINKGMWIFNTPKQKWYYMEATNEHEEVICFLVHIIESLESVFGSRGAPKISNYVKTGKFLREL